MASFTLYENLSNGRVQLAAEERLSSFQDALSSLTHPGGFSVEAVQSLEQEFGNLTIEATASGKGTRSLSLGDFFSELQAPMVSRSLRGALAHVSSTPGSPHAFGSTIGLSGFCEIRTGLSALSLPSVQSVSVAAPNSAADRAKHDVELSNQAGETLALQVKGRTGKKSRIDPLVPTIRHVLIRSFEDLKNQLQQIVRSKSWE